MTEITKEDIEKVLSGVVSKAREELYSTPQNELDKYWYFRYDKTQSKAWNLYKFNSMLDLYKKQCRQWEEHHNGSVCVVERVRDTYLMAKIKQFIMELENHE